MRFVMPPDPEKHKADPNDPKGCLCVMCNTEIQAVGVLRSVHDGPAPLSGSGQVVEVITPYCPMCEEKPNHNGPPVTPDENGDALQRRLANDF